MGSGLVQFSYAFKASAALVISGLSRGFPAGPGYLLLVVFSADFGGV